MCFNGKNFFLYKHHTKSNWHIHTVLFWMLFHLVDVWVSRVQQPHEFTQLDALNIPVSYEIMELEPSSIFLSDGGQFALLPRHKGL